MTSPLFSGQTFVLKGVSHADPQFLHGNPKALLGPVPRIHLPLSVALSSTALSIEPAYDTGASVSVMSQADFNKIKYDTWVRPIRGWSCAVTAANGTYLKLTGAYLIRLFFKEKSYLFAFLISPDVTTSLFGLNLSCHYGMSFDAINRCIYIPKKNIIEEPSRDGKPFAKAILMKETSVDALTGQKVRLCLNDLNGNRLQGLREGLIDLTDVAYRFDTDQYGRFEVHINNAKNHSTLFPKGHMVGEVFSLADWKPIYDAKEAAAAAAAVEQADVQQRPVRKHTQAEKQAIIAQITKQVNISVPYQFRQEYIDMLSAREHAFSADDFDLGHSGTFEHEIHFTGNEPCYTPQFRLSDEHLSFLKNSVMGWLKAGIIQRTRSLHNSPIFCVDKKALGADGRPKLRPVLDYRRVNSRSLDDRYSILTIDDCLNCIGKAEAKVFSSLDFRNSYWQLALRKQDRPLTAFTLPGIGQFAYVSCPQGLLGAPASYSRLMEKIMADAQSVLTYLDDTLVFTKDHARHIPALASAIDRIINANLRLNPEKCIFGSASVPYLGVQLNHNGIEPGLDKVSVLADMAPPTTLKALKSVCGLFNWFRKFIFQYARKVEPLHRLTQPASGYKEGPLPKDALTAFYRLRREITSRPILAYPNSFGRYHLYVDACLGDKKNTGGYGAALLQEQRDGSRRPIAFASRLISGSEVNYPCTLAEWSAAVYGMNHFAFHLRGRRFFLYSDHKPLARPFEDLSTTHIKTLHRLNAKAVDFHPDVKFIEGKANSVADFLSRYFGYNVAPDIPADKLRINANVAYITHVNGSLDSLDVSPGRMQLLQANDPYVKVLIDAVADLPHDTPTKIPECPHPVTISNNLLCVQTPPRSTFLDNPASLRIVVPDAMKKEVMSAAHHSLIGGHSGSFKVAERIRDTFWWKSMQQDIEEHLRVCAACRTATNKFPDPTPPLKPIPVPTTIGEVYFSDLFGPLTDLSGNKNTYVLTVTDAFSKFVRLYKIDAKDAITVAQALYKDFSIWSPPRQIITDGGKEYRNAVQKHLMQLFGTRHSFTSIYHPQTDGMSEVFNKTLRHFLATALLDAEKAGTSYELFLPALQHSYNSSVSHATHVSPFTTHFGTKMRVPLWPLLKDEINLDPDLSKSGTFEEYVARLRRAQLVARQLAHDMAERAHARNKAQHDKSNDVEYKFYSVGARVLVRRNDRQVLKNQKLAAAFEPAIIRRQVDDSTYLVRRYLRRRARDVVVHSKLIKELPPGKTLAHEISSADSDSDGEEEAARQSRSSPQRRPPSPRGGDDHSSSTILHREGSQVNPIQSENSVRRGLVTPGPPPNQERQTDRQTPRPPAQDDTHTQTVRPQRPAGQPEPTRRAEQGENKTGPRTHNRRQAKKRRRPPSPSSSSSTSSYGEESEPERGEDTTSQISAQISDHSPKNPYPAQIKKYSQTCDDPILKHLPQHVLTSSQSKTDVAASRSPSPSLDSDGLPQALSDSDVDLSSLSSDGRRRRNATKRSLRQSDARRKVRRVNKGTKRAIPENAHSNMSKRTRSGLLYFISTLQSMPSRKRNKLFKSYANYNVQQLYEALMNDKPVDGRSGTPAAPAAQMNAGGFRPTATAPPKLPPLTGHRTTTLAPPSIFQADKRALRRLLGQSCVRPSAG